MSLLIKSVIMGCLTGMVGLIVSILPFGPDLEKNVGLGLLFKVRGAKQAPSDAVVISIDKESSEHFNVSDNPDKWPRSLHARLIDNLVREGAKVIAFDVHFIEPRSPEGDSLFAKAVSGARNIILCEPMKAREIQSSDKSGAYAADHSIVKIVQPIAPFACAAGLYLWDSRKYCSQRGKTAFIRFSRRQTAYLSAGWKSPQMEMPMRR